MKLAADMHDPNNAPEPQGRGLPEHLATFRWKPGQSGNPKGRSPSRRLSEELRDQLASEDADGVTLQARIAERLIDICLNEPDASKTVMAAREIFDRADRKPRPPIDVSLVPMELSLSTLVSMIGPAESLPVPNLHELSASGELVLRRAPAGELEGPAAGLDATEG